MISPGYYDIAFDEEAQSCDADGGNLGPVRVERVCWPGARVLMVDGADLIIEHYPVGWRNVVRRIDRVGPEWQASMTFKKVEVPCGA